MRKSLLFAIILYSFIFINCQGNQQKADQIHKEALTIDTHCDTPLRIYRSDFDPGKKHDPHKTGSKVDFIRMQEGGLDAQFFAAFISQGPRTEEGHQKASQKTFDIIDAIYNSVNNNSGLAAIATEPDEAFELQKKDRRAIYIGIENGYALGGDLSLIDDYYKNGVRYITLCHTSNNDICDSSTDTVEHHGLSEFGKKVVRKMNQKGMIIDVSHISDQAFYDVVKISKAPVIASHSCARAICDHPRNMSDAMLKKLKENGGVIQLCILSAYIKELKPSAARDSAYKAWKEKYPEYDALNDEEKKVARAEWHAMNKKYPRPLATVSDAVDHIDHIVELIGIDHVGIGTDFDGGGALKDCYDVSEMPNITRELVKRGYSKTEIEKIWGENFLRVFREVKELAQDS